MISRSLYLSFQFSTLVFTKTLQHIRLENREAFDFYLVLDRMQLALGKMSAHSRSTLGCRKGKTGNSMGKMSLMVPAHMRMPLDLVILVS